MNIESIVASYQPSSQAIELVKNTHIVLLVGISGAGKDTIKQRLLRDPGYRDIVSYTTRSPRVNNGISEQDGVHYHFISNETAKQLISRQEFLEVKLVHGTVYGTGIKELNQIRLDGKTAITDLDVQGVSAYRDMSSRVVAIFIIPPSYEVWLERLRARYESNEVFLAEFSWRRDSAIRELREALEKPYYHFIVNDDLDRSVRISHQISQREEYNIKDIAARIEAQKLLETIESNT